MTTIHENGEKYLVLSKGAPEIIIDKCKHIDNNGSIEILDDSVKETLTEKINEMSDKALRVLGIAYVALDAADLPIPACTNSNAKFDIYRTCWNN